MRYIALISLLITLILTTSIKSEEVTTNNLLNQNFDSGSWSGTADGRHGSDVIAAHNNEYIISDDISLRNDAGLTEDQIKYGFSGDHEFQYWHWNDYESTVQSTITITGQSGETTTQIRTYNSTGCGYFNCGSFDTGSDSFIISRNTETDYSISVQYDFSDTSNATGHYGVDLKEPSLTITYESEPIFIEDSVEQEIIDLFDDFKPEDDIKFEDTKFEDNFVALPEPNFAIEEEFGMEEPKFKEEPSFEEPMVMEMPEEQKQEEPKMELMTQLFVEENEDKEDIDNSTDEGIIEVVEEESKEEEKTTSEMMQEGFEDEQTENEQAESDSETTQTANATKESNTKQEKIQSRKTKTANAKPQSESLKLQEVMDKIDEKVKDIGKNLEFKNLIKIKAMSNNDIILDTYNVPFYKPKDIYLDQVNIADNRDIYSNINLNGYVANDPIATKVNKINELQNERQQLLIQLEVLKNEL